MTSVSRKADLARSMALLRSMSFDIKFDLEDTGYKRVENIGTGAYGVVCSAIHKKTSDRVAIKKIPGFFDIHVTAMRTYREIKILKHFKHDNIISIREILKPKESLETFKDVYVVLDLMESDLHRIIYSNQDLTDEHCRYFLYQLLRGVKYIHSANVIHRDLKPSNLLVNEDCQLKIGDFGMARGVSSTVETEKNHFMTQYVATRWYRAPEIMMSLLKYSAAVDIWSVGCIFAEMLGRKHLFPGKDYMNQLKLIIGVLGSPPESFLHLIQSDIIKKFVTDLGPKQPLPWSNLLPRANRKALNLLCKMLVLHPKDRITAEQALKHPYLSKYHDTEDEPTCIPAFNFDFEKQNLKGDKLRHAIVEEILEYHQPQNVSPGFNAVLKPVPKAAEAAGSDNKLPDEQGTGLQAFLNQLNQKQANTCSRQAMVERRTNLDGTSTVVQTCATSKPACQQNQPDQIFKKPVHIQAASLSVKGLKQTETLDLPSGNDVEMLSAKVCSNKADKSGLVPIAPSPYTEKIPATESTNEKPESKTISEDTKATLKATLLNARKMRAENCGVDKTDLKSKVTALSRQKEREKKRKKKAERASERKKKLQDKKGSKPEGIGLSVADKELLERWKGMQNIRPSRPASMGDTTTMEQLQAGDGIMTKPLTDLSNSKNASLGIENHRSMSVPSLPSRLQQQNNQATPQASEFTTLYIQQQTNTVRSLTQNGLYQQPQNVFLHSNQQNVNHQSDIDDSIQSRTSYEYTQRRLSDCGTALAKVSHNSGENVGFKANFSSNSEVQGGNFVNFVMGQAAEVSLVHDNSLSSSALTQDVVRRVGASPSRYEGSVGTSFVSHRGSDPLLQGYGSPSLGSPQTSQSESGSTPSQGLSPLGLWDDPVCRQTDTPPSGEYLFGADDISPFQLSDSGFATIVNTDAAAGQLQNNNTNPSEPSSSVLFEMSQSSAVTASTSSGKVGMVDRRPHSMPQLRVKALPQDVADQDMPSATRQDLLASSVLNTLRVRTSFPNEASTSDVMSICRQMSKNQVEDIYPQPFPVTPKGTGSAYGIGDPVGPNPEYLALESEISSGKPDSAPLSASLLADWMEVTGNMSAIDLEALIQESGMTSPMAVSYSDFTLSS